MKAMEILNYIEEHGQEFIDLHIIDNQVVGFYKTHTVKYKNAQNNDISYLFPVTITFNNNKIETTMTFGSVERNFIIPNLLGTITGIELITIPIYPHLYNLLSVKQSQKNEMGYIDIKAMQTIIATLEAIDFPFMRITNNNSLYGKEFKNLYGDVVNARKI
jgi:hypothetical protein